MLNLPTVLQPDIVISNSPHTDPPYGTSVVTTAKKTSNETRKVASAALDIQVAVAGSVWGLSRN